MRAGRLDEATVAYQASADVRRDQGDTTSEIGALVNLGLAAVQADRFDLAESTFRHVLARNGPDGRPIWTGVALAGLGEIHWLRGELDDALERKRGSLALFQKIDDQVNEVQTVLTIAQILHRQGRSEESAEHLRVAMELNQSVGLVNIQGIAWELEAELRHDRGDDVGALEALREARDLLEASDAVAVRRVHARLEELSAT